VEEWSVGGLETCVGWDLVPAVSVRFIATPLFLPS
jgi:hypothetical protein